MEKQQIPAIVTTLVNRNIHVYAVQPKQQTLEDQFLEMTGGGQIAEANTK